VLPVSSARNAVGITDLVGLAFKPGNKPVDRVAVNAVGMTDLVGLAFKPGNKPVDRVAVNAVGMADLGTRGELISSPAGFVFFLNL